MRRIAAAIGLATMFGASSASAVSYNDIGDFATFTIGGSFSLIGTPPASVGETVRISASNAVVGGTEEMEGVTGSAVVIDPLEDSFFDLIIGTGAANNGEEFFVDFDRGTVIDVADGNLPGTQTGTLIIAVTGTTVANVAVTAGGTQRQIDMQGLVSVAASGFYDPLTAGSFSFSATIGAGSSTGTYSLTVSVPPAPGTDVPLPAGVLLLLSGVAGLGYVGTRRTRA